MTDWDIIGEFTLTVDESDETFFDRLLGNCKYGTKHIENPKCFVTTTGTASPIWDGNGRYVPDWRDGWRYEETITKGTPLWYYKEDTYKENLMGPDNNNYISITGIQILPTVIGLGMATDAFKQEIYNIKKVIFNYPATIILWGDGTKTVVKCGVGEVYDPEKGIAMCLLKKLLGNKGNYNDILKKVMKKGGVDK